MSLDTLSIARELRAADVAPAQAEAIASAIGKAVSEGTASKTDVELLVSKVDGNQAVLVAQNEAMEQRLTAKIEGMRSSILIWLIGVILALAGLGMVIGKAVFQ